MSTTGGHRQRTFVLSLLTLLTLVGAIGFGPAVDASATTRPTAETRVRAIHTRTTDLVAAEGLGSSTAVGVPGLSLRPVMSATGVATEDGLVDLTGSQRGHILDGEVRPNGSYSGGHRFGTGFPGKSEFPAGWSDDQITHAISDVATDPASVRVTQGGAEFVTGTRDGIDIEVIVRNGEIKTGYPTNTPRNP